MKRIISISLLMVLGTVGLVHTAMAMNIVASNSNHSAQILVCDHSHAVSIKAANPQQSHIPVCPRYPYGSYNPEQKTLCIAQHGLVLPAGSTAAVIYIFKPNQAIFVGNPWDHGHNCELNNLKGKCDVGMDVTVKPVTKG